MKPTEAQIIQLETAHKLQYADLVQANILWLQLAKKLPRINGQIDKNSKQYKALKEYGTAILNLVLKWYYRQRKFEEKAKIPPVPTWIKDGFLTAGREKDLVLIAKYYMKQAQKFSGIGFIPLIIWGAIALIAAFTAYEITNELNTTAQEKSDLLVQTQKTLKELNITGPEAAAIITQTQAQASEPSGSGGLFSGIMPKLVIGGIALYLFTQHKNK